MLSFEKIKDIAKELSDDKKFTKYPMDLTYYLSKDLIDKINEDIFYKKKLNNKDLTLEYTDVIELNYKHINIILKVKEN